MLLPVTLPVTVAGLTAVSQGPGKCRDIKGEMCLLRRREVEWLLCCGMCVR